MANATKKELKEMIVELKMQLISTSIPIGHCPYAYYKLQNPLTEACGDVSCSRCRQVFLGEMKKIVEAEIESL